LPESIEHIALKNLVSEKLKEWFGCSIMEYPSAGHELDVFAITNSGISIYVEIIWSPSLVHFLKDLSSVEHSDANVKIVIANPEILQKKDFIHEFYRVVAHQRKQGFKIHGDMVDGSIILGQDNFLDMPFRKIVETLISETEKAQKSIVAVAAKGEICPVPLSDREVDKILKDYSQKIINQYTLFSTLEPALPIVVEQLSKFDFEKYYVDVFLQDLQNQLVKSSEDITFNWLDDPDRNGLFIIGDFGTGKSTLCANIAYLIASKFLNNEISMAPLLVSLRKVEGISEESIAKELKKVITIEWEQILQLLRSGKLLLILDGFDEIPRKTDWEKTIADFENIVKIFCVEKSKIITTCRTHFFKKDSEIWGEDTELMKSLRATENFKIVSTLPFSEDQIREYIEKRTDEPQKVWEQIQSTYNLQDLCKRPLLADMIISTLPKLILLGSEVKAVTLYEKYTEDWINREDWRSQLKPSTKEELMERLADYLYCQGITFISSEDLQELIEREFSVKKGSDVSDYYDYDVRTCSFFRRDSEGKYSFMHKSFLEFFAAKKISKSINNGLTQELGKKSLSNEVVFFASQIINSKRVGALFEAIYSTRGKLLEEFGVLGGNALKLLFKMGESKFVGKDFSSCTIKDVNLSSCEFYECNFEKVRLCQVTFCSSSFSKCSFSEGVLDSCNFSGTRIVSSNFTKGKFILATLKDTEITHDCQLDATEFSQCLFDNLVIKDLELNKTIFSYGKLELDFLSAGISFINCKMQSVKFEDTSLQRSLFEGVEASSTDFVKSDFRGTCFHHCIFSNVSFVSSSLSFASLLDVTFSKTKFVDSRLYSTYLDREKIGDAIFENCNIKMSCDPINKTYQRNGIRVKFDENGPAYCALDHAVESFSLNNEFENRVVELYLKSWHMAKGDGKLSAMAACFYTLIKETDRPRTIGEITTEFNTYPRGVFRAYKKLLNCGYSKPKFVSPEIWLEIFSKELKVGEETKLFAKEVLRMTKIKRLTRGRVATTNAAACLYIACKENSEKITLQSIGIKAGLSTTAIRQTVQTILKGLN
jgi:uncharacterized protein YjbI with pentapeptide repeats/DNA replication protein DnaC